MRLTFMVVFFTIYNAQSQRKRKVFRVLIKGPEKMRRKTLNWCSCEMGFDMLCVHLYVLGMWRNIDMVRVS